jgi:hypothetical protein
VLLGLPYYEPLPIVDIPTFYRQVAEEFPDVSIMICNYSASATDLVSKV